MRRTWIFPFLIALAAITFGLACKSPAPAPGRATTRTDDADAKARAEAEARRRAEEERRKREEQERLEKARLAEAEKLKAFQKAADAALQDVHFDYDKSDLRPADKAILEGVAGFMRSYPQAKLTIEGHCDERGTAEYNIALGDRRAHAALDYLAALGLARDRFTAISYGKERPLCTEASEACWGRNRRGHFALRN